MCTGKGVTCGWEEASSRLRGLVSAPLFPLSAGLSILPLWLPSISLSFHSLEVSHLPRLLLSLLPSCHLYFSCSPGLRPCISLPRCLPPPKSALHSCCGVGHRKTSSCSGTWLPPLCCLVPPLGSVMPIGSCLRSSWPIGRAPGGSQLWGGWACISPIGWGRLGLGSNHGDFGGIGGLGSVCGDFGGGRGCGCGGNRGVRGSFSNAHGGCLPQTVLVTRCTSALKILWCYVEGLMLVLWKLYGEFELGSKRRITFLTKMGWTKAYNSLKRHLSELATVVPEYESQSVSSYLLRDSWEEHLSSVILQYLAFWLCGLIGSWRSLNCFISFPWRK